MNDIASNGHYPNHHDDEFLYHLKSWYTVNHILPRDHEQLALHFRSMINALNHTENREIYSRVLKAFGRIEYSQQKNENKPGTHSVVSLPKSALKVLAKPEPVGLICLSRTA